MRNSILVTALLLATCDAVSAEPASLAHTITVSGAAVLYVDPDHASIALGVVTEAPTVSVALGQNNAKMSSVLAALHGVGVRDNQIQTSTFSIGQTNAHLPNGQIDYTRYDGYAVTNKLTVTVSDLSKVGAIIDAGAGAGANSSNNVVFQVEDQAAYLDKVRAAAVRDARHKAEVLAGADGAQVGALITIGNNLMTQEFETAPPAPPPPPPPPPAPGTSIMPGQLQVTANVTVVFALK